ncbi:MAG: HAMP domain-containing histidine kinase [Myxococcaceae bacterium]|nr:HAMP domain-containing histidine kinase [Myxococcaceae bacterium]
MRAWVSRNAETVVLAGALAVIATLVVWWAVFTNRLIHDTTDPARAERLTFMIRGESGVFAFALVACMLALFAIARRARNQRQRMERLLQFTSHELKTPIAGVRALLQSLSLGSIPDDSRAELLGEGVRECDRLEHLAETILAYQRTVTRQRQRERLRADVLLDEVMSHRKRTTQGEQLEVAPLPKDGLSVWADRDAFRVILENLLDNARKYGNGATRVSAKSEGTKWRVEVRDGGQGFEPHEVDALFDPFTPRKSTGVTHGSGLGLSISRQLARQMGGDLVAASDGPGKGSTFTLVLSAADA